MDRDLTAHSAGWKVGTAAIDITPTESMWLAGWAARREPASGTATPLYAKAMVIEDAAGTKLIICTVDLIAVTREVAEPAASRIKELHGIPREHILFNASHTHTGPEIRPDKALFFGIPDEYARKIEIYREWLIEQMTSVISEALKQPKPVELYATATECEIAENRRKPPGPVDYDVPLLYALDDSLRVVALLFGYACHNLTLPPTFVQYCSEFAGEAARYLHETSICDHAMFLSGAGADIDPRKEPLQLTTSPAENSLYVQHGNHLATEVTVAVLGTGNAIKLHGPLSVAFSNVELQFEPLPSREQLEADLTCDDPPKRTKARYLLDALDSGRELPTTYPCPLQVVNFGKQMLLIAMSAEPVVQFALDFKKQYGPRMVWVAGYCNNMFGYIATEQIQEQGGYEGGRAFLWSALPGPFTRDTERRVRKAIDKLVREVGWM